MVQTRVHACNACSVLPDLYDFQSFAIWHELDTLQY